jgi:hypothetical protein
MSLRAELVRLCLPWFMQPRFPPDIQIEDVRLRMARFVHLIPPPPRGTEVIAVDACQSRAYHHALSVAAGAVWDLTGHPALAFLPVGLVVLPLVLLTPTIRFHRD